MIRHTLDRRTIDNSTHLSTATGPVAVTADSVLNNNIMSSVANNMWTLQTGTGGAVNPHFDDNKFTSQEWFIINRYLANNNGTTANKQPWDIIPFKQRLGEPRMYEPEVPIIYLNRAYMHCIFRHIEKPTKIVYEFPRPFLDNRLMRKTKKIVLTIDAQLHAQYNIWGVDYRHEPTFQYSMPRNAFTLHLIR